MTLQGTPPLVAVAGAILDPLRVILPLQVTVGRSDPSSQPNANAATFSYLGPPDALTLDAVAEVYYDSAGGGYWGDPPGGLTGAGGDEWSDLWSPVDPDYPAGSTRQRMTRFRGRITDLDSQLAGDLVQTAVTCIGRRAELGNVLIGDVPWPQETEAQRVTRILALFTSPPVTNHGSSYVVNPRDVDRQTALQVLEDLAASTGALVVEHQDGTVSYDGNQVRTAAHPSATLTEFQILDGVGWTQSQQRLIQQVTIVYGPLPIDNSERATVFTAGTGRLAQRIDSQLANLGDAQALAALILARWSDPTAWDAPQIQVPVWVIPSATWDALMALTVGDLLNTESLASDPELPSGQVGQWFIEGWVEDWDRPGTGENPLEHHAQYAVSDFTRWRSDIGAATVTTAVADATAGYGTPRVITATTKTTPGNVAVNAGQVTVYNGATLLAGPVTPDATGKAVLTVPGTALPAGTYILTVKYKGQQGVTKDSQTTVTVTVLQSTAVAVTCSVTPSPINDGQAGTIHASVTPTAAVGAIQFEYSTNGGGTFAATGAPVTLVNGSAALAWVGNGPSLVWQWRARFMPSDSNWQTAVSPPVAVDVRTKTTRTLAYAATWSASWQSDGDKRSDTDELWQGYYSSTNGNQRGACGFSAALGTDWAGWTVTKVEIYLYYDHWYSNGGGTAIIGAHQSAAEPAGFPAGSVANKQAVSFGNPQGKWVDVTSWGVPFTTGYYKGILTGPGPSTSSAYYGSAVGTGGSRPQIRVTGYRYA